MDHAWGLVGNNRQSDFGFPSLLPFSNCAHLCAAWRLAVLKWMILLLGCMDFQVSCCSECVTCKVDLGTVKEGKRRRPVFGLEVVRCDNYDIHPYPAFVHRCTSVLLSEQNNTKLTKRNSVSTKQIVLFGDF